MKEILETKIKPSLPSRESCAGKTCLITGGNIGIGLETGRALAELGFHVILACRSLERGAEAVADIQKTTGNKNVECIQCDVSSLESVRKACQALIDRKTPIHALILNAGIMTTPYSLTKDGYESQFATNHLGHFLMANLLLPILKQNGPSRIVTVSSAAHHGASLKLDDLMPPPERYDTGFAYQQSKLANIMFAYELQRRLDKEDGGKRDVVVNAVHPGVVASGIWRHVHPVINFLSAPLRQLMRNSKEGAYTVVHAAVAPELNQIGGKYLANCKAVKSFKSSYDETAARKLWEISEQLVGLKK